MDKWKTPKGPGTHVLMDGGILDVPNSETREFYSECVHAIRTGSRLYVVEQKTEIFKFFVDLDFKCEKALPDDSILELVNIMSNVVGREYRCCIARAEPRQVGSLVKTGVHVHWPTVFVTKAEALAFRTRILLELPDDPEWGQRIDASVYGGSGLRMLWSYKKEKGVDSGPYIPWRDLSGFEFSSVPDPDILELFSVRTDKLSKEQVVEFLKSEPLEHYIRKYMKGHENVNIRKLMRKGQNRIIVQTDSRYCERIGGCHKSNHVWFGIQGGKICQLCHDDECKEAKFIGKEYNLSPSIVAELRSNVAVDNSTYVSICDFVPDFWWSENANSQRSPSVLGTQSRHVGSIPQPHRSVSGSKKPVRGKKSKFIFGD